MICEHRARLLAARGGVRVTDVCSFSQYRFRYTYNPSTSKWSLLTINAKKKKAGGSKKRRAKQPAAADPDAMAVDEDVDMEAVPEAEEEDESEDDQVYSRVLHVICHRSCTHPPDLPGPEDDC